MADGGPVIAFDVPAAPQEPRRFAALERRLLSVVIRPSTHGRVVSPQLLQRVLALLYVTGATIGLLSMAFPQPEGTSVAGLLAVYGIAYCVGGRLFATLGRAPAWTPEVALAFG